VCRAPPCWCPFRRTRSFLLFILHVMKIARSFSLPPGLVAEPSKYEALAASRRSCPEAGPPVVFLSSPISSSRPLLASRIVHLHLSHVWTLLVPPHSLNSQLPPPNQRALGCKRPEPFVSQESPLHLYAFFQDFSPRI